MKYIPAAYKSIETEGFTLWHSAEEPCDHIEFFCDLIGHSLQQIFTLLEFQPRRELHCCLYHSNQEAQSQLNREIDGTMLLAPYSDLQKGMVVLQSPDIDKKNHQAQRMLRHITHEITHLLLYDKTGSEKVLGDGNINLNLPSWFSEGFAEVIALNVSNQPLPAPMQNESIDFEKMNNDLDDLCAENRSNAFKMATSVVYEFIIEHGIQFVFDNIGSLTTPSEQIFPADLQRG